MAAVPGLPLSAYRHCQPDDDADLLDSLPSYSTSSKKTSETIYTDLSLIPTKEASVSASTAFSYDISSSSSSTSAATAGASGRRKAGKNSASAKPPPTIPIVIYNTEIAKQTTELFKDCVREISVDDGWIKFIPQDEWLPYKRVFKQLNLRIRPNNYQPVWFIPYHRCKDLYQILHNLRGYYEESLLRDMLDIHGIFYFAGFSPSTANTTPSSISSTTITAPPPQSTSTNSSDVAPAFPTGNSRRSIFIYYCPGDLAKACLLKHGSVQEGDGRITEPKCSWRIDQCNYRALLADLRRIKVRRKRRWEQVMDEQTVSKAAVDDNNVADDDEDYYDDYMAPPSILPSCYSGLIFRAAINEWNNKWQKLQRATTASTDNNNHSATKNSAGWHVCAMTTRLGQNKPRKVELWTVPPNQPKAKCFSDNLVTRLNAIRVGKCRMFVTTEAIVPVVEQPLTPTDGPHYKHIQHLLGSDHLDEKQQ